MGQMSMDICEKKKIITFPYVSCMKIFVLISLMIWTHPKNWGTPFSALKMTKTEGAKIVSRLEKVHHILFKNQKVVGKKKKNLKKQKH